MNTTDHCEKCGATLPSDAPRGLCPRCLLQEALVTTTPGDKRDTGSGTHLRYFGEYELLEKIAQGGMGIVYRARQTKLNRLVAVKMILGGQLATEADIHRFLVEAESAA